MLKLDVAGAALATVLAQLISVIASMGVLKKGNLPIEFKKEDCRIDHDELKKVLNVGVPIALQETTVQISFLVINSIINGMGLMPSAGYGVAQKLTSFIMLIPSSVMQSVSAFVAQNTGAGKKDRAWKGFLTAIATGCSLGVVIFCIGFFGGSVISRIFTSDPAVIEQSAAYLRGFAPECILTCVLFSSIGYFNGRGISIPVMIHGNHLRLPDPTVLVFFALVGLLVLAPVLIILGPQSDLGTAMICVVGILAVMWLGEVPLRTMLIVIGVVVALGLVGIFGSSYRRDRLMVFMNPWNDGEGGFELERSVGGLATGLGPLHEQDGNLWIGWADADAGMDDDERARLAAAFDERDCRAVFLDDRDAEAYYEGFSNSAIWPLFHGFPQFTRFDEEEWEAYRRVNERFCEAALAEARPGDTLWIQDYHLMLLPSMLREALPDASIGFFLHIPFPDYETFRTLPWRDEIVRGVLGADLIGFHAYDYVRHFLSSCRRVAGIENTSGTLTVDGRVVQVDASRSASTTRASATPHAHRKCKQQWKRSRPRRDTKVAR